MKKLINLTVYDAKNMICVWNENEPKYGYLCGIALEDACVGFTVPQYYVVGVFDDGSSKAAGIRSLSEINQNGESDNLDGLFTFDEFAYYVDILCAKAFVRWELAQNGNLISEKEAMDNVYKSLLTSGVKIDDEARNYLIS
jgi:hypothetical protein